MSELNKCGHCGYIGMPEDGEGPHFICPMCYPTPTPDAEKVAEFFSKYTYEGMTHEDAAIKLKREDPHVADAIEGKFPMVTPDDYDLLGRQLTAAREEIENLKAEVERLRADCMNLEEQQDIESQQGIKQVTRLTGLLRDERKALTLIRDTLEGPCDVGGDECPQCRCFALVENSLNRITAVLKGDE